uniref:Uncharacterized protein n=1 Tax=Fagus sylvatica TaxID=28930 RepID=A0A2N9HFU0_FAGSY
MTPQHGKTLQWPLFVGPYLVNPSSPPRKSKTLRKRVAQAFQRHQDRRKPTSGAMSTVHRKIDERKKTMLKISQFTPEDVAFAHRFFPTRCDLIRKSGTLRKRTRSDTTYNSRIVKILPGLVRISIGKQPSDEEKHSGGLCSWDRISRAQARLLTSPKL